MAKKFKAIPIERGNLKSSIKSLEEAERRLAEGYHICILPEGTRSLDGKMLEFKKGGFHMAINTKAQILPIGISGAFGSVNFSMDYRRSSNNFIFGYWDKNYDHNRIMENNGVLITKESTLYQYGSQKGFNLGLEANVSKYFKFSLDYTRMKGNMWGAGSCDNDTFITSAECTADNQEDNPGTPDIDESEGNNIWMWGQYQTDKNNSLYAKFEIDTSSIPKVQIAEVFYQQTNSDKPFNFKPNENTLIGYNIGVDLSNNMIVVLKGRKSYEFDGNGYKPVHSTQIETSVYF